MPIPPPPADPSQLATIPPPPGDPSMLAAQPSMMGMAGKAIGQTLSEPLPLGIGSAAGALRQGLPNPLQNMSPAISNMGRFASSEIGMPLQIMGQMMPRTGGELAVQAISGPLTELGLNIAGKTVVPAVKWAGPKIAEFLTGFESPIIEEAFKNAKGVAKKLGGIFETDLGRKASEGLKKAVIKHRQQLGREFGNVEDTIASKSVNKIPVDDITNGLKKDLANAGYRIKGYNFQDIKGQPTPFGTDPLPSKVGEVMNDLNSKSGPISLREAIDMKRKVKRVVDNWVPGSTDIAKDTQAILFKYKKILSDRIQNTEPVIKSAYQEYSKMRDVYKQIEQDVLGGDTKKVAQKVAKIFRSGTPENIAMTKNIESMGENASKRLHDMIEAITAQSFNPRIHPTVSKAFKNTGGGMAKNLFMMAAGEAGAAAGGTALGHPGAGLVAPVVTGLGMAATSPRLNFRIIQASTAIAKELSKFGIGNSKVLATAIAPTLQRTVVDKLMDDNLNASQSTP